MKKIIVLLLTAIILSTSVAYARDYAPNEIAGIMKELEIMEGDPDGNLRLEDQVTRAEFTKMAVNSSAYRNMVSSSLTVSPFGDVTYQHWAAPYVLVAVQSGMVTGYPDATFRPNQGVKLEEALNILLKMLGYTDQDFGLSYPYGQIALADNLDITDGVDAMAGDGLTRLECMTLVYNTLRTFPKGKTNEYMNLVGYTLLEDTVIMATNATDTAVSAGYVALSDGYYKMPANFDETWVGKRGTALVKNGKDLLVFLPDVQRIEHHTVYQVLGDKLVTVSGGMKELSLDDGLTVYHQSVRTTFMAMLTKFTTGDVVDLYYNASGELEYATVTTGGLEGPITASGTGTVATLGLTNPTVMKNGKSVGEAGVSVNDILYYSKALNTVWCYDESVTGVYTAASPNQDMPQSITLSGKVYSIESIEAFRKLSSGGTFSIGDTVTVLLGRTGSIADVVIPNGSSTQMNGKVHGYLIATGNRIFQKEGNDYSAYYASVAMPDGSVIDYEVKKEYDDYLNSVVCVTFADGVATLSPVTGFASVSGYVDWNNHTIGSTPISSNVKILDVADMNPSYKGLYTSVQGQRIDGLTLRSSQILYAEKNANGEITVLILKEVTGDMYRYGIVSESSYSASNSEKGGGASAYLYHGTSCPVISATTVYRISKGQPVQVAAGGGNVDSMKVLEKLSGFVSEVTATEIRIGNNEYPLSDSVSVYQKKNLSGTISYALIPLSEITGDHDYTLSAYMDKSASYGGRVRIIIAE